MGNRRTTLFVALALVTAGCVASGDDRGAGGQGRRHAGAVVETPTGPDHKNPHPGRVPRTLADGTPLPGLPKGLTRFRGRPVVRAVDVPRGASEVRRCLRRHPSDRIVRFEGAWLSPEGLTAGYVAEEHAHGSPYQTYACDLVWVDGRWRDCGHPPAPGRDPAGVSRSGGGLNVCERPRMTGFLWVPIPPRAAWALVERRRFWVLYPAADRRLVRITANERVSTVQLFARLTFLDAGLRELVNRRFRGYVAG